MDLSDGLGHGEAGSEQPRRYLPLSSRQFFCIRRLGHKMEQLPYLSFLAGSLGPRLWGAAGGFWSLDQWVFLHSGPRSLPQRTPESGQTRTSNSPGSTTFPAQAVSKRPVLATHSSCLHAPKSHLCPTVCPTTGLSAPRRSSEAAPRNVSKPIFQVFSRLLVLNTPLTAHHGFRSSCPSALKLQRATEIPFGIQNSPWEPHRSQPGILGKWQHLVTLQEHRGQRKTCPVAQGMAGL